MDKSTDYFTKDISTKRYTCKGCDSNYSISGTGNLKSHLVSGKCSMGILYKKNSSANSGPIDKFNSTSPVVIDLNDNSIKEVLSLFIITAALPFSVFDNEYFSKFISMINSATKSRINIPSEKTFRRYIKETIYPAKKDLVNEKILSITSKIAITIDCWTSKNRFGFLGILIHFIENGIYKTVLFDCVPVLTHTSKELLNHLVEIFGKNILQKIIAVGADNASTNYALAHKLSEYMEEKKKGSFRENNMIGCLAHTIQLSVKDFLKDSINQTVPPEIDSDIDTDPEDATLNWDDAGNPDDATPTSKRNDPISRLRKLVVFTRRSLKSSLDFIELVTQRYPSSKKKKLIIDVPTRWSSTFSMISRAIELQAAVKDFAKISKLTPLDSKDWDYLIKIAGILKIFDISTQMAQADKATIAECIPIYDGLEKGLSCFLETYQDDKDISNGLASALNKLSIYKTKSDKKTLCILATVLHPRYRLEWFRKNNPSALENVKKLLVKYYDLYSNQSSFKAQTPSKPTRNVSKAEHFLEILSLDEDDGDEINKYYNCPLTKELKFDPFKFWHFYKSSFPILSRMANDILCIPCSTGTLERFFSCGVDVVTPDRSSLKSESIQILMSLMSWQKSFPEIFQ